MPKYNVLIREVHVSHRTVEADNEDEAIETAARGEGEETYLEYSHSLDTETWILEEIQ